MAGRTRYLTDGFHLYRALRVQEGKRNYGLAGGVLERRTIVEDCMTEAVRSLTDLEVATCTPLVAP